MTTQKVWAGMAMAVVMIAAAAPAWAADAGPGSAATTASSAKGGAGRGSSAMPAEMQKALAMAAGAERAKAVQAAAMNWEKSEPKAACDWVLDLPKGNADQAPLKSMVMDWGARDGSTAVAWVMSRNPKAGTLTMWALHLIVTGWAGPEPAAAAAWAAKLPKGDQRKTAYNSVGEGWARKDAPPAGAWVAKLPEAEDRQAAVGVVAGVWSQTPAFGKNPEVVTAWAEKLATADLKLAAAQIAPNWARKDAAKAEAWVAGLPLAAAEKAEIIKKFPKK